MSARAMEGTSLETLVRMAVPMFKAAERQCPRTGPGRPPDYADWQIAVLVFVAVSQKKKSKSAQYRYLQQHQKILCTWLGCAQLPARSTYFERYRSVHRFLRAAIAVQGNQAAREGVADPRVLAVDKSLMAARGPVWHQRDRKQNRCPAGVDRQGGWGYSDHDEWVYGYSYEVAVTATNGSITFPMRASAHPANTHESKTFPDTMTTVPQDTESVLVDAGYDQNATGECIEYDQQGRRTGRRFVCPPVRRRGQRPQPQKPCRQSQKRQRARRRRDARVKFYRSRAGRRLYARRKLTVEPFNSWFKQAFELEDHVWHHGLDNNATLLMAAIFIYQTIARCHHRRKLKGPGGVKAVLDCL